MFQYKLLEGLESCLIRIPGGKTRLLVMRVFGDLKFIMPGLVRCFSQCKKKAGVVMTKAQWNTGLIFMSCA